MIDIPLSSSFKKITPIHKGMSSDTKYYIETLENKHYLLRIADISEYAKKRKEYVLMNKMFSIGVPMPKTIDLGVCNKGKNVYTMLDWIVGEEVQPLLPTLAQEKQYLLGVESGKILKLIHSLSIHEAVLDWSSRYFSVINERLNAFKQEGIPFAGSEDILHFLEHNQYLLKNRPQCYHHGDYHLGNMIRSSNGRLNIIDWHTIDFDNYGDPWYEFNRISNEYPAFASGQINGYFANNPPENFWILFAYYLSASAITSIVWAKYSAPKELKSILQLNADILSWFDNMKNPVPTWYREYN